MSIIKHAGAAVVKVTAASGESQLDIRGSVSLSMSEYVKETIVGVDGVHYKDVRVAPWVEVETFARDINFDDLAKPIDKVEVKLANGRTATLEKAVVVSDGTVDAIDGVTTIRFEGVTGSWQDAQ